MPSSKKLVNSIKQTLLKVQRSSGVPSDNPALVSLKQILRRRLREVENAKDPEHPPVPDWTRGYRRCCWCQSSEASANSV